MPRGIPNKKTDEDVTTESAQGTDAPGHQPLGSMTIKGEGKSNAVGLFQTAPNVKEYLTADEAREKGFYVAPTEEEKGKKKKH